MRIGYPCINRSLECRGNKTFRLKSYSEERLIETVSRNIDCLEKMLRWNVDHDLLFFRISSDLVPFASHEINDFDWVAHFQQEFRRIGAYITDHEIRISMHPDQFTVLNSKESDVVRRSVAELTYHAHVLDALHLPADAKIQVHVGGVYGNKKQSMRRFAQTCNDLPDNIRRRLVIENDDRLYSVQDCLEMWEKVEIPVLFDTFHHELLNNGESWDEAIQLCGDTWTSEDGMLMLDYSSQAPGERTGKHIERIDIHHFQHFLSELSHTDFDLMLEIKDKEKSALQALQVLQEHEVETE